MAALPQNSTNRVFVDYITGSHAAATEHTAAFRFADVESYDDLQARVLDFLSAVGAGNLWTGWRVLGVRGQNAGTNFTFPIPLSVAMQSFTGTGSYTGYSEVHEAVQTTWMCRSFASGRRGRIDLYGIRVGNVLPGFRLTTAGTNPAWIAASVNALNGVAAPWVAIDGVRPVWYQYVNFNYNSYWEEQKRRT